MPSVYSVDRVPQFNVWSTLFNGHEYIHKYECSTYKNATTMTAAARAWHPNERLFDPEKVRYFDQSDPEGAGLSGLPKFADKMPRTVTTSYRSNKHNGRSIVTDDNGDQRPHHNEETTLTTFTALQMGPCPIKHTLIPGDLIVVHDGSGYSLMSDDRRWRRNDPELVLTSDRKTNAHSAVQPYLAIFREYNIYYDDDGNVGTDYEIDELLEDGSRRNVTFMPFDVVKNVRVGIQHRSATTIQRTWRAIRAYLVKRDVAIVSIQRAWLKYCYECSAEHVGPGFFRCQDSYMSACQLVRANSNDREHRLNIT